MSGFSRTTLAAPPPIPNANSLTVQPLAMEAMGVDDLDVRIDITVIDEGGPQTLRERVTLTTVDRQEASLRSDAEAAPAPGAMPRPIILNVDATPQISGLPAGKVRVRVEVTATMLK